MALYTNLPVYKTSYDVLLDLHSYTNIFIREHKYTIGEKLKEESIQVLIAIFKANKAKKNNRLVHIDTAREHAELLRLLSRIAKELEVLTARLYVALNLKIEEVSKQLTAWQKYTAGAIS
jgi:phosphoribosyl-ATP pyrophosphohydrolase